MQRRESDYHRPEHRLSRPSFKGQTRPASATPHAYINDAFSFLNSDQYSAYKQFPPYKPYKLQEQRKKDAQPMDPGVYLPSADDDAKSEKSFKSASTFGPAHSMDHLIYNAPGLTGRSVSDTNIARDVDDEEKDNCSYIKWTIVILVVVLIALVAVFVVIFKLDLLGGSGSDDHVSSFDGIIIIQEPWSSDLNDSTSDRYNIISFQVLQQLKLILTDTEYKYSVQILSMREGSIEVWFYLLIDALIEVKKAEEILQAGFLDLMDKNLLPWEISDPEDDVLLTETKLTTTTTTTTTTTSTSAPTTTTTTSTTTATAPTTTTTDSTTTTASETESTAAEQTTATTSTTTTSPTTSSETSTTTPTTTPTTTTASWTTTTPQYRTPPSYKCQYLEEARCRELGYQNTGFPNGVNIFTQKIAAKEFNELMDLTQDGCYEHSLEFACAVMFPECDSDGKLILPCRRFCKVFVEACSYALFCDTFSEDDDPDVCVPAPAKSIPSTTPTSHTNPCRPQMEMLCNNYNCVPKFAVCDGRDDCGDYSDELYCGEVSNMDCDFETDICQYLQSSSEHFDWQLHSGATETSDTGPSGDHTYRNSTGKYLLAEASGKYPNAIADLISPEVTMDDEKCLRFYYHMYGSDMDSLKVHKIYSDGTKTTMWRRSRNQGNEWRQGYAPLHPGTYKIEFEARRGEGHKADIAIDDVTVRTGTCAPPLCPGGFFRCNNGNCVQPEYTCDSIDDCGDYSDEISCDCTEKQYRCDMGLCLPAYFRCDGETDCPDGSDEAQCSGECESGGRKCPDGRCIMLEWVCDGEEDCKDGSDEQDCDVCHLREFQCQDKSCIPSTEQCDGRIDCPDASDEDNCARENHDGQLQVQLQGRWLPLCGSGFPSHRATDICRLMGHGPMIMTTLEGIPDNTDKVAVYKPDTVTNSTSVLAYLSSSAICPSQEIVNIICSDIECGSRSDKLASEFVVNGNDASPGQWPWHVGLIRRLSYSCGGTLISPRHVVTAAHCVPADAVRPQDLMVKLGTIKRTESGPTLVERGVRKIDIPVGYIDGQIFRGSDIAVLTLSDAVTYDDYIRPACLPEKEQIFTESSICYAPGWGYVSGSSAALPQNLQEVKMQIWDTDECRQVHLPVSDSMICAGYKSGFIATCIGDSGGGMVCQDAYSRWYLVGALSFVATGCTVALHPPVYTRVQSYLDWIYENIDLVCQFTCGNGHCIYDSERLCNGIDDCGDFTDELMPCDTSVSCSFDEQYTCGYSHAWDLSYGKFEKHSGSVSTNRGPFTDQTMKDLSGSYMYADYGTSMLISPAYHKDIAHCLRFTYHSRGGDSAARLLVFKYPLANLSTLPSELDFSAGQFQWASDPLQLDLWHTMALDIKEGTNMIAFETYSVSTDKNDRITFALDDVELLDGTCAQQSCPRSDMSECTGMRQGPLCYEKSEMCDFVVKCIEETDETNCLDMVPYLCDFEKYGLCGVEQPFDDALDWKITHGQGIEEEQGGNGPAVDASLQNDQGLFAYINTVIGVLGSRAKLQMPIRIRSGQPACLQFRYNMVSNGGLRVSFQLDSKQLYTAWAVSGVNQPSWELIQIRVHNTVNLVVIDGTVGRGGNLGISKNYIALDDLEIRPTACEDPVCKPGEFQCPSNGQCLIRILTCNGQPDCPNGEDEDASLCVCTPEMFECDTGQCIRGLLRCDGVANCPDNSDEYLCNLGDNCPLGEYSCGDSTCKNLFTWCDGFPDCTTDKFDEQAGCECLPQQFQCQIHKECIPGHYYCDGYTDCLDATDEVVGCDCDPRWHFECRNGECIHRDLECNLVANCADGSDEMNCDCPEGKFQCDDLKCIDQSQYCNGIPDCADGSDEDQTCECTADQFKCESGGCIDNSQKCDLFSNCEDSSDEKDCSGCPNGFYQCNNGLCISETLKCNSRNDCGDYSDENICSCTSSQFRCTNGMCITNSLVCNYVDECEDQSDEVDCGCRAKEFTCTGGGCIQNVWVCDGTEDCADGSDENGCRVCSNQEFQCPDKTCIPLEKKCDQKSDCPDSVDELGCVKLSDNQATFEQLEIERGGTVYPVCVENWILEWSDAVCHLAGEGPALTMGRITSDASVFLKVTSQPNDFRFSSLETSNDCNQGVVKISCEHKACGTSAANHSSSASQFVIGGELAPSGRWPWMGGLYYLGNFRCGATLIDDQWVVTAAHCFIWQTNKFNIGNFPHYFYLQFASTKLNSVGQESGEKYFVEQVILHPNYNQKKFNFQYNDIALVKLRAPVAKTEMVKPVCLPDQDEVVPLSSQCWTSGWGFTRRSGQAAPDLREAKMRLWSHSDCSKDVFWGSSVDEHLQLCAGYETGYISTCHGDSGGPLMCQDSVTKRWHFTGITSVGETHCGQGGGDTNLNPNIFARVTNYITWLKTTMQANR